MWLKLWNQLVPQIRICRWSMSVNKLITIITCIIIIINWHGEHLNETEKRMIFTVCVFTPVAGIQRQDTRWVCFFSLFCSFFCVLFFSLMFMIFLSLFSCYLCFWHYVLEGDMLSCFWNKRYSKPSSSSASKVWTQLIKIKVYICPSYFTHKIKTLFWTPSKMGVLKYLTFVSQINVMRHQSKT